jgi:hypothetical protein
MICNALIEHIFSALASEADISEAHWHFRLVPEAAECTAANRISNLLDHLGCLHEQ